MLQQHAWQGWFLFSPDTPGCSMLPAVPSARRLVLGALLSVVSAGMAARADNPPPTQLFYVPFSEDHQLAAFDAINATAADPITVFVTLAAATDGTVIYYDHWEDGYERDITNPVQPSTQVLGDGNPANGYPPGNPADLIPAGTVFNLRNFVATATLQSVVDYDARDKIASFKPISVTKTTVPAGTNTLLAGCVEVFERGLWGTEYRSPVGVDMPQTTPTATLTQDENLFSYTGLAISAGPGGASVQIDKDNNGVFEETVTLAEGETVFRSEVNAGGHVLADKPVQVVLFTGTIGSNYASRDTSLLPTYRWSNDYFAPVSTRTSPADGTVTFLYNPGDTAITVSYDYRSSASAYTTSTISVPARGNARVTLQPANGTDHFGAYRFYTTGANPPVFYAMSAIDADAASGSNQNWDGGFTLVGRPSLTTQVLLSLGIGRDPYSATNPNENGNPLWITTSGNGHTQETVYVDYNGDNVGALTDPNGNKYDVALSLRELEQAKIFDPDGDQSGMLVYTLNPSVRIAAAWGQDPAIATVAQPGLDVASLVPPMREGDGGKRSSIAVDADGDGEVSCGDTLEYDIRGVSNARTNIPGPFAVQDDLPATVTYVPGSTRYRFMVGDAWQAWTSIPDDGSGTPFPLDGAGFSVPGNLASGQQFQVTFRATIVPRESLTGSTIENTGQVEISPYGLLLPISWTDTVYGSIGDRLWADLDGDGVQDPGESGIPNIEVHLDRDNDGIRDAGEPVVATDASGNYLFAGLTAGNYVVRVDPADIAAANVGYGPTYDLDGIATSHVAAVTLGIAEDRLDVDFGYRVGASVGDRVWMDRDNDGVQENGEPGINGVRVYLDANNNNAYDSGEPNTVTSGDGTWYIGNLNPGTYAIRVDTATLPASATQTFDLNGGLDHEASVTLLGAEHRGDLDFGYRGPYSIGDLVWEDVNADGISSVSTTRNVYNALIDISQNGSGGNEDDGTFAGYVVSNGRIDISGNGSIGNEDDGTLFGVNIVNGYFDITGNGSNGNDDDGSVTHTVSEAGIANVRVYLDMDGDGIFDATEPSAVTNSSGVYSIGNLFNGTYLVRVVPSTLPSSYVQTYDLVSPISDHTASVTVSGANRTDVDFGYRNDASLGDLVWNDRDNDGVRDVGEPGIPGVWVYIDSDNDNAFDQGIERFEITDLNGFYRFENLAAGTYNVRVEISTLPQGSTQTYDLNGGLDHEASRTLTTSQEATDVDFGYRASAAFGDYVWNDADADGVQDGGETGIASVRVYLDINGNGGFDSATESAALTDSNGAYSIGNLVPGTYTARIDVTTLPANMTQTFDATGGLDHAATFTLSATQTRTEIDFGYTAPVTIGDLVWNDEDGDGQKDAGESGLSGVTVTLYRGGNDTIAGTTTTNASGLYSFTNLMPGSYYVVFDPVAGFLRSTANQGADASDSDADASGRTPTITLSGGQSNLTLDAGYFQPGSISGSVLADTNNDNSGDVPLSGVVITLKDGSGNDIDSDPDTSGVQPTTTATDGSGAYAFTGLTPGSYQVVQTQPAGYLTVTDGDTTTPEDDTANANGIDNMIPVAVAANETDSGNDFVEEQPVSIAGAVFADTDGNGSGDTGLAGVTLLLLDGSGNPVLDGSNQPVTTVTAANGTYLFGNLPPGSYRVSQDQPGGYSSVSDVDGANNNLIGDQTPIVLLPGDNVTGRDFVEVELGSVAGSVFDDTDDNGSGDAPISGVTLALLDGSGQPVLDGSNQPVTTVSAANGSYYFANLLPGSYQVAQTQPAGYGSVSDVDGGNLDLIGSIAAIAVAPGQDVTGRDFVEIRLGAISGFVFAGTDPLSGVTLALLDENGDPVLDGNGDPITTVTGPDGSYSFTGVFPGIYQVAQVQPAGYDSFGDADGGDINLIGDVTPIVVLPGETNEDNNFIETLDTCANDWPEWLALHPGESASGNPDADVLDNLAEFAFAQPHDSGAGDPFCISPSETLPGTLEGKFVRPKQATDHVTYILEHASVLGTPTTWQSVALEPGDLIVTDNGDCSETVVIFDLEDLTGLTGGEGFVRVRAELDEDEDETTDHISRTATEGWTRTPTDICCRTYNNPYLRCAAFTGTIDSAAGSVISLATSAGTVDLATVLQPGTSYYAEITSGDNEGHRFDVVSASGSALTVASDSDLAVGTAPFNTLAGTLPAGLDGDGIVICRHWTLGELFPPEQFGATGSQFTADQVQVHSSGVWTIYWLYDAAGTPRWVKDASLADQGAAVIPPGQGMFFNSRHTTGTLLAWGQVRDNDFIRPLSEGSSLVGGGYPVDQAAMIGRAMTLAQGFFGSRDFKKADRFYVWKGDAVALNHGYDGYFLLNGAPVQPALIQWTRTGDATIQSHNATILFQGDRAVFMDLANDLFTYQIPTPWTP